LLPAKWIYFCSAGANVIEGREDTCQNASVEGTVSFSCEVAIEPRAIAEEPIGIDVGLQHFATFSNGQQIDNPRFFKKGEKSLAKAQRKLCKTKYFSPRTGWPGSNP